jgi:aromatic-L-amino-acid decarboxylase
MRARIAEHLRLASLLAGWIDADPDFERLAPAPMSVVCFRARPESLQNDPAALDKLNERLLLDLNAGGRIFLSHTKLRGAFVLRVAIGHARTTETHVADAWALIRSTAARLA